MTSAASSSCATARVTIDADYIVDKAHKHPNPPEKDGDLHAAGRSEQIGLPTVAEIENAADVRDAVDKIHAAEASGQSVKLSGYSAYGRSTVASTHSSKAKL